MKNNINENDEIIIDWKFRRPNRYLVLTASIFLVLVLGVTDYISGYEMSFSIFYLIPISLTVFLSDFKSGFIVSVLSAITWFVADISSGHEYQTIFIPLWNSTMRFGYFILHSFFIYKFIRLYQETKINSLTDSLTGAVNSRFFMEIFEREVKMARRTGRPLTLVYFDLDDFKLINDTFGHNSGDSLLKMMARLIAEHIRPSDVFARLGGDEFSVLLPETDSDNSIGLIRRMKELIELELKKFSWPVTLSIGAVTFRVFDLGIEEMIKQADDLMYQVKKSGKNNIEHVCYK